MLISNQPQEAYFRNLNPETFLLQLDASITDGNVDLEALRRGALIAADTLPSTVGLPRLDRASAEARRSAGLSGNDQVSAVLGVVASLIFDRPYGQTRERDLT